MIVGSRVNIKGRNELGTILRINGDSVDLMVNNEVITSDLGNIVEVDLSLIQRLSNNELNEHLQFILSINSNYLLSEYKFNPYVLASATKINIFPHQIDEVIKILDNPRMMIADEVGLGKTIIAALVATELKERGLAHKVLYVVPKSLVIKWQEELRNRFDTSLSIVNSDHLRQNDNPFQEQTFALVSSMDFLKQKHILKLIQNCNFDLVVVDEAHKLTPGTERFELGRLLSQNSNFLIFLTATPHNGNNDEYVERMKLLDPFFYPMSTNSHLMTRNIKEDVVDLDGKEVFPPRTSKTLDVKLSESEQEIHRLIDEYINNRIDEAQTPRQQNIIRFMTIIIRKRASSSFYALKNTIEKRIHKIDNNITVKDISIEFIKDDDEDELINEKKEDEILGFSLGNTTKERADLTNVYKKLLQLEATDSKLELLSSFITTTKKSDPFSKIVVFTEYRDTLNYLRDQLSNSYSVGSIDGTMDIHERNNALNKFRDLKGTEILVCTDAAGEGIDMQFCNIEVNYDLPWNPNRLEQRMGRIHRIGQIKHVYYYNFVIVDTLDGKIIKRLLDKMENIKNAIGDKIYDVIGQRLINEDEIVSLYVELLKIPKEYWEAKIKLIDGIIEEKGRIISKINELLLAYKLDRTKLGEIKRNAQNVIRKEDLKKFVKVFIEFYNGKLESINLDEDTYRIIIPKHISQFRSAGTAIVEGCFDADISVKKNYTYFALGNSFIMNLICHASSPSVACLGHSTKSGVLLIYKVIVKDMKGRERSGRVLGFFFDDKTNSISDYDVKNIWEFDYPSYSNNSFEKLNFVDIKEMTEPYLTKFTNEMVDETSLRLKEIEFKTEEAMIRYYSKQMENMSSKVSAYQERISDSPKIYHRIQKENERIRALKSELDIKLRDVKNDFNVYCELSLVGVGRVGPILNDDNQTMIESHETIHRLNEFSKQNQQINTENSWNTHQRFQNNPKYWYEYHEKLENLRRLWTIDPLDKIIIRLKRLSPRLRIGDFGCGKAKIMNILGKDRVLSFDHVATNANVIACDMRSVPLENGYLDVVVFSLSLMGKNWPEYIREANRCLMSNGFILIADTFRSITQGRLAQLKEELLNNDFEIFREENWDIFYYMEARKK